jgi:hypothetical protein
MQASRTYFRRRETNEVPLENEKGPPRGALNATRTQQPGGRIRVVIAARPSGLTRQPAMGVRRSVIQGLLGRAAEGRRKPAQGFSLVSLSPFFERSIKT